VAGDTLDAIRRVTDFAAGIRQIALMPDDTPLGEAIETVRAWLEEVEQT
jgi:hypothetical protein